jgi:hypothetical protein
MKNEPVRYSTFRTALIRLMPTKAATGAQRRRELDWA